MTTDVETILNQIDETKQIEVGNTCIDVSLIPVQKEEDITEEFLKLKLGRKWRITNQIIIPFCFKLYTTQTKKKPITILQDADFWKNIKFNGNEYNYNQKDVERLIKYCIKLNIINSVTEDWQFRYKNPNDNYGKFYIINNYNLKSFLNYNNVKVKWTKELVMKIPTPTEKKEKVIPKKEQKVYEHFKTIYLEEEKKQTNFFKYYCNGQRPTCEICYDNSLENLWKHNLTEREDGIIYREDKLDEIIGTERTVFDIQAELPNLIRLMNKGIICLRDRETFDFHSFLCGRPFTSKEDRNKQKIMCLTKVFGTKKDLQSLIEHFPGYEKNTWKYNKNHKWNKTSSYKKRFMEYINAANISLKGKTINEVETELLNWWDNTIEHFNSIVGKEHYKNSIYFIEGAIMMKLQNKLNDRGILTERVYDEVICKGKVDTKLIKELYIESIKECGIKIKEIEE